ncbi:MAG TPA: ComEC/Rec2 family competence protein [Bacteroidia bacterium]|nr:ComEC/Rec2 family competence protein [Bacteroidia bacterium]
MNPWNELPFVRLLIALVTGIVLAINIPTLIEFNYTWLGALLIFIYLAIWNWKISFQYRFIKGIPSLLLLVVLGVNLVKVHSEINYKSHFNKIKGEYILIKINEPPKKKQQTIKAIGEVIAVKNNAKWTETKGKLLVYISKSKGSETLKYGDIIVSKSKIVETPAPKNPQEFNYKKYLAFHQIYHQTYIGDNNWINLHKSESNKLLAFSYQIRSYFISIIEEAKITGNELAIGSALILGFEDNLSNEVIGSFAATGALHVLSVSGLHVGIIFLVLNYILQLLGESKTARVTKLIVSLLGLWFYALITGMSPSVWRAATMFSLITIGKFYNKDVNTINIIGSSAFILLCINPFMITEVGFQLSYLAVIGIVTIHPWLYSLIEVKNKILNNIWSISCVSVAAQFITFPLGLLYFHQFPNYFLFSNLIVIPISTIILYVGVLLLVVSKVPFAGIIVSKLLFALLWLLKTTVSFFEHLPYAIIDGISISTFEALLLYAILIGVMVYSIHKKISILNMTLSLCLIFILVQIKQKVEQKNQQKIIFYAINKHSAIDIISGQNNVAIFDSALFFNKDKIRFHITANRNYLGVNHTIEIKKNQKIRSKNEIISNDDAYLFFNNHVILYNFKPSIAITKLRVIPEIVLVNKENLTRLSTVVKLFPRAQFIFDGTISLNKYKDVMTHNPNINMRSVLNEGAIIFET